MPAVRAAVLLLQLLTQCATHLHRHKGAQLLNVCHNLSLFHLVTLQGPRSPKQNLVHRKNTDTQEDSSPMTHMLPAVLRAMKQDTMAHREHHNVAAGLQQLSATMRRLHAASHLVSGTYFIDGHALANLLPLEILATPQNPDLQASKQS